MNKEESVFRPIKLVPIGQEPSRKAAINFIRLGVVAITVGTLSMIFNPGERHKPDNSFPNYSSSQQDNGENRIPVAEALLGIASISVGLHYRNRANL